MNEQHEFLWGTATSAYQIEGAWNEDGKGLSIWDTFCDRPGKIKDGTSGRVTCDHYHRVEQDVAMMAALGLNSYRFSISWPRVFPQGQGPVNHKGLDFYKQLVDTLLKHQLVPMITLYHWDLPQALEQKGGWLARDTTERFAEYAALMVKSLGDRVRLWTTINEPATIMTHGYISGKHAPGFKNPIKALRACHFLLLAHAKARAAIKSHDQDLQVGLVNCFNPVYKAGHRRMVESGWVHHSVNRLFMDPVYHGRYPAPYQAFMNLLTAGRLQRDLELIAKPLDFLGVNYYMPLVKPGLGRVVPSADAVLSSRTLPRTAMGWPIYPQGLADLLHWLDRTYKHPLIYVTENGAAFEDQVQDGLVEDRARIDFLSEHIQAMRRARRAGVRIKGYYVWSWMDNFEWSYGLSKRFGIVYNDAPQQQRLLKASAHWYGELIRQGIEQGL